MTDQHIIQLTRQALAIGDGVVRLMPTWVPRVFCVPGRRLRLHQQDLYAFGAHRGGSMSAGFPQRLKRRMAR